jgi:hypothetical protein
MKALKLSILLFFLFNLSYGQNPHTIKVFFLYGSKPSHGYRHTESHYFGGLHGGHVSIGIDSFNIGFHHVKGLHLFSLKKHLSGIYQCKRLSDFTNDTSTNKYATFEVPLTDEQYNKLNLIFSNYMAKTPYDYAFFGMRCAAAAYDVLSQIGLFKEKSRIRTISSNFYPKRLRKKMFKLAQEKQLKINTHPGRNTRVWESD